MTSDLPDPAELGAVVVGVDASPQARAAALWAAAEAELRGQPLGIVHAADIEGRSVLTSAETLQALWDTARDVLDETARAVREKFPDLIVTEELSRGDAVAGLRAAPSGWAWPHVPRCRWSSYGERPTGRRPGWSRRPCTARPTSTGC
ncbi:universal stress protein [Streptomyces microflavus]|uniref:universal stress protein n=1 Tax=Streptomyces microflavus TaxID=1919 RepID=UPI0033B71B62